jgi:hypothetical protein
MFLLILVVTTVLACVAFISNLQQPVIFNPLYTYYFFVVRFMTGNLFIFGWGLLSLTLIFWLILKPDKNASWSDKILAAAVKAGQVSVIGLLLSAILIFAIAVTELNILAVLININPKVVGVKDDKEVIVQSLKNSNRPPEIVTSDPSRFRELLAVAVASAGKDNFYGSLVLPSVPSWLVIPIRKSGSSMLLVDNTLIISEINPTDLQTISPIIGYRLVKQIFANRAIKSYPQVAILADADYLKFRQQEADDKLAKIDSETRDIETQIETVTTKIKFDQQAVTDNQNQLNLVYRQRETQYQSCLVTGRQTEQECKNQISSWDEKVTLANTAVNDANWQLESDQKSLKDYQSYLDILTTQASLVKALESSITSEAGQFVPADSINMVLNPTDPTRIADYISTLTHEYLHYASYISGDKFLPDLFFEEGLTEYFARKAIKNNLQVATNVGYPAAVKIIEQMTKRIPESELADIYFAKDQSKLEAVLDRVYGDNFYKQNRVIFTLLLYTADEIQALKLANTVVGRMGGEALKINDLVSTPSSISY